MTPEEKTKFLDECAMRAMQAFVRVSLFDSIKSYASASYRMADAMLEEKLRRENEKLS